MDVSLLFEFVTEGTKHAIKSTSLSLFNMLTAQMASSYDENATFPAKAAAHAENAILDGLLMLGLGFVTTNVNKRMAGLSCLRRSITRLLLPGGASGSLAGAY